MSFDISLAMKTEQGKFVDIAWPEYDSPTYNLGEMFRACTGWNFNQGEYYNCKEVEPLILHGIRELVVHESNYYQYDAPNGWGTTEDALKVLMSMYKCIAHTSEEKELSFEELWIRW